MKYLIEMVLYLAAGSLGTNIAIDLAETYLFDTRVIYHNVNLWLFVCIALLVVSGMVKDQIMKVGLRAISAMVLGVVVLLQSVYFYGYVDPEVYTITIVFAFVLYSLPAVFRDLASKKYLDSY